MTKKKLDSRPLTMDRWKLIDSWNGNDDRFWHREGGKPFEEIYWIDDFCTLNPSEPIISIARDEDLFTLKNGMYKLVWDCDYKFKNPACTYPDFFNSAISIGAFQLAPGGWYHRGGTELNEVYICDRKEDLIYAQGIESVFYISKPTPLVDFPIYAYTDFNYGKHRRGHTNGKEIIIYRMELYEKV